MARTFSSTLSQSGARPTPPNLSRYASGATSQSVAIDTVLPLPISRSCSQMAWDAHPREQKLKYSGCERHKEAHFQWLERTFEESREHGAQIVRRLPICRRWRPSRSVARLLPISRAAPSQSVRLAPPICPSNEPQDIDNLTQSPLNPETLRETVSLPRFAWVISLILLTRRYISDQAELTQSSVRIDATHSAPSAYAVRASGSCPSDCASGRILPLRRPSARLRP